MEVGKSSRGNPKCNSDRRFRAKSAAFAERAINQESQQLVEDAARPRPLRLDSSLFNRIR
jgi:hypothetical protein